MTADMNIPLQADTDMATATPEPAADAATVTMVTTEDAARLADVSVRTIRRWIQHGHLASVESDRGKLVSPADIPEAKRRAGRGHDRGHGRNTDGHDRGHDNMATDTATAMTAPALSSATAQMEAIRDQWLLPLVNRIGELERENGRLETERDQVARERDALRVELTAAQVAHDQAHQDVMPTTGHNVAPTEATELPNPSADTPALGWRRWWRRMTGGA